MWSSSVAGRASGPPPWCGTRFGWRSSSASIRTSATPERVWQAWTDPATPSQWFTDEARGEARVGGTPTWIFKEFGVEIPYPNDGGRRAGPASCSRGSCPAAARSRWRP